MQTLFSTLQRASRASVVCLALGLGYLPAAEASLIVTNSTNAEQTYDVSVTWPNTTTPPPTTTLTETITLKKGESAEYGGAKGRGESKGQKLTEKDNKVFRNGVRIVSLTPVLDSTVIGMGQLASLIASTDGLSDVYSFFDFGTAGYQQLVADTEFTFDGFAAGRIPILTEVGTGIRMTNVFGQLLAQYQFNGAFIEVASVSIGSGIPEPSTLSLLLVAGLAVWRSGPRRMAGRPQAARPVAPAIIGR